MARFPIDKARLNWVGSGALIRYIRLVRATSRIVSDPPDLHTRIIDGQPQIIALWHGQTLVTPALSPAGLRIRIVVAHHVDGNVIADVISHFGLGLIRGAGANGRKRDRGGARALLAAKKSLEQGWTVAMTADMPPGPARRSGLGIVMLARMSGRPIVPMAVATSRYHALNTWNRLTINLPWSTLGYVTGEPIHVARDADEAALEVARLAVEMELNAVTRRAYALCGADPARSTPRAAADPPAAPGRRLQFYRLAMRAAEPLAPLILARRARQGKEDRVRRNERLGIASRPRPEGDLVWVHAASVGELNAILPLIAALRVARAGLRFLVTTGTTTSAALAGDRLETGDIHQYIPLDSPGFVARFLNHWRPTLAVFTESEVWPNLILAASDRAIPLALVNGRLSHRSYGRWMKQRRVSRPLLNRFAVVLTQTEKLSRWFTNIGARHAVPVGNLKVDAPPLPVDIDRLGQLQAALGARARLLFACTHQGEEEVAADVHLILAAVHPGYCTIIVPRHPERGGAIISMLRARGFVTAQRSAGELPNASTQIYVADTIGELGTLYRLVEIAFLGKSLGIEKSGVGGQNPIEAIRHGAAVITGPHVGNFHEIYQTLFKYRGAALAATAAELAATVQRLHGQPAELAGLNAGGRMACDLMSGALALTVEKLLPLLPLLPQLPEPSSETDTLAAADRTSRLQRAS